MALLGLALLCGCTTLAGKRFDLASTKLDDKLEGVPFTMNKPTYTVTRIEGADGAQDKYTIKIDYVPDPANRFVLRINPTILSSVDFAMTFDDNGTLTDTTAKVTDQTGPVLTSLGKLAAAAIGTLDLYKAKDDDLVLRISSRIDSIITTGRPGVIDPATGRMGPVTQAHRDAWVLLRARLFKAASLDQLKSKFFYQDPLELGLLMTALEVERATHKPSKIYLDTEAEAKKKNSALVPPVRDALNAFNRDRLLELQAKNAKSRSSLRASLNENPSAPALDKLEVAVLEGKLIKSAIQDIPEAARLMMDWTAMKPGDWRARKIAELNKLIEQRQHLVRVSDQAPALPGRVGKPPAEEHDPQLNQLLRQKALLLGQLPEYERRQVLERLITNSRNAGHFKVMADEIAFLDKRLLEAEGALKAAAAPAPKADEPTPAVLISGAKCDPKKPVDSKCITDELGSKRPTYVILSVPGSN